MNVIELNQNKISQVHYYTFNQFNSASFSVNKYVQAAFSLFLLKNMVKWTVVVLKTNPYKTLQIFERSKRTVPPKFCRKLLDKFQGNESFRCYITDACNNISALSCFQQFHLFTLTEINSETGTLSFNRCLIQVCCSLYYLVFFWSEEFSVDIVSKRKRHSTDLKLKNNLP